jgi:acetamidase/formamidase
MITGYFLGNEPLSSLYKRSNYTVKKVSGFSRLQSGFHLPISPWPGILKLFPAKKNLVSDIPAELGKTANLFLQCILDPNSQ